MYNRLFPIIDGSVDIQVSSLPYRRILKTSRRLQSGKVRGTKTGDWVPTGASLESVGVASRVVAYICFISES